MSTVAHSITAFLHQGPHDGQALELPRPSLTLELGHWEGRYLTDAGIAIYRRVGVWDGGPVAHYEYRDVGAEGTGAWA
jgi:hypothetical protein